MNTTEVVALPILDGDEIRVTHPPTNTQPSQMERLLLQAYQRGFRHGLAVVKNAIMREP